jgi:hypothetical protein
MAAQDKPRLPREAKRGRFKSLDRLFVLVLALSLLAHLGAYGWLSRIELPPAATLEEIPDRYARLLVPERPSQARPAAEEKKPAIAAGQEAAPEEPDRKPEPRETPEQADRRKAARAAAIAKAVQSKGVLKVLGALGPGAATGAVAEVFEPGGGMGDVASALAGAGALALATDPVAPPGGRRDGGEPRAASIGALTTTGAGQVGLGAKREVRVSGSVAAEEADVESSDIDEAKLGAFVRARIGLIRACYESALKRNPHLAGRLSIRFTILATGGLADVSAGPGSLGAPEVAACVVNTMRSWRTQFRPAAPVAVEYPFLFAPVSSP